MSNGHVIADAPDTVSGSYRVSLTSAAQAGADMLRVWSASGLSSSADKLHWYYHRNPLSQPDVLLVRDDDTGAAVGTCSLGFRQMLLDARPVLGANRCDLAVVADHRGGQVTPVLLEQVRRYGEIRTQFVYGFPNAMAERAVAKAGFHRIGRFHTYTKVLDWSGLLSSKLGSASSPILKGWLPAFDRMRYVVGTLGSNDWPPVRAEWVTPDERLDAFWQEQVPKEGLIGVRDSEFLRWRFDRAVHPHARVLAVFAADEQMLGYAVLETLQGKTRVLDFLTRTDPTGQALTATMNCVFETARQESAHVVHLNFFGGRQITDRLRDLGMSRRAGRPVYVAGRLSKQLPLDRYYLTMADEDI
ncbi:MAG TPA: hypothetical protein VFM48_11075 [Aquabacterium sp.]|nr:hypothetical protein [Aquabacterium sp.]